MHSLVRSSLVHLERRCAKLDVHWALAGKPALVPRRPLSRAGAGVKQVAKRPSQRWGSIVATIAPKPEDKCLFVSDTLLFGETAAVYAFNRVSKALVQILVRWLGATATAFFDDFAPCRGFFWMAPYDHK